MRTSRLPRPRPPASESCPPICRFPPALPTCVVPKPAYAPRGGRSGRKGKAERKRRAGPICARGAGSGRAGGRRVRVTRKPGGLRAEWIAGQKRNGAWPAPGSRGPRGHPGCGPENSAKRRHSGPCRPALRPPGRPAGGPRGRGAGARRRTWNALPEFMPRATPPASAGARHVPSMPGEPARSRPGRRPARAHRAGRERRPAAAVNARRAVGIGRAGGAGARPGAAPRNGRVRDIPRKAAARPARPRDGRAGRRGRPRPTRGPSRCPRVPAPATAWALRGLGVSPTGGGGAAVLARGGARGLGRVRPAGGRCRRAGRGAARRQHGRRLPAGPGGGARAGRRARRADRHVRGGMLAGGGPMQNVKYQSRDGNA